MKEIISMNNQYNKVDPAAIKGWRISQIIKFIIALLASIGIGIIAYMIISQSVANKIIIGILIAFMIYRLIALVVFPNYEYAQWGYIIEDDKIVIKHGIFFIKTVIVPVIRIQNITLSQGPINRKLGLYNIEIALASGNHDISGLNEETAKVISENLKQKLYERIEERGEVL